MREDDEEEGWSEVSDWRVCKADVWVGSSERRVASMAEGRGGVWGIASSIGVESGGERSRVSHCWRSVWRLVRILLLVIPFIPIEIYM